MEHMLTILIIVNLIINIAALAIFELKKPAVREFLPLVVICAGASLGRVIFSFIPQIQPVTVLVIITGSAYGSLYGYVTGSLCALISNMMLGQGPWTPFQMTAWGTVGLIAGLLGHLFKGKPDNTKLLICADDFWKSPKYIKKARLKAEPCKFGSAKLVYLIGVISYKEKKGKGLAELAAFSIYGFLSAILFSIITDTLTVSYLGEALTLSSAIAVFATGIAFNIGHAVFNAVLIVLLYHPVKGSLLRCRHKV